MSKTVKSIIYFLILHFGALYVGAFLMGSPNSEWYQTLNRAPWTPPGFVFGLAWFTIMICVSIALGLTINKVGEFKSQFIIIIAFQLIFNVLWNPLFFRWHLVGASLFDMFFLAVFVFLIFLTVWKVNKKWSLLVLPYMIWVCIASSLNVYIWLYN